MSSFGECSNCHHPLSHPHQICCNKCGMLFGPVEPKEDDIKAPSHYTQGKIEVVDFIKDQKLNYCEGNVVKYICRYKFKGTPMKDLLKARQYIDFILEDYEQANKAGSISIVPRDSGWDMARAGLPRPSTSEGT